MWKWTVESGKCGLCSYLHCGGETPTLSPLWNMVSPSCKLCHCWKKLLETRKLRFPLGPRGIPSASRSNRHSNVWKRHIWEMFRPQYYQNVILLKMQVYLLIEQQNQQRTFLLKQHPPFQCAFVLWKQLFRIEIKNLGEDWQQYEDNDEEAFLVKYQNTSKHVCYQRRLGQTFLPGFI